jgi:chromosome partitioning protein
MTQFFKINLSLNSRWEIRMIITVANNQEGIGRSTIAVNIAAVRRLVGRTVLLIDLDPKKSSFAWSEARNSANIQPQIPACVIKGKHFETKIAPLISGYNDVLIDTDWRNTKGAQDALSMSDMVIVPIRIGNDCVDDLKHVIRRVKVARRTNPDLWVLVVIVRTEGALPIAELDKIRNYIAKIPSTALAGTVIRERASLQQAFSEGRSIFEYKPADPHAVAEMHDLYRTQKMRRTCLPSLSRLQKNFGESRNATKAV